MIPTHTHTHTNTYLGRQECPLLHQYQNVMFIMKDNERPASAIAASDKNENWHQNPAFASYTSRYYTLIYHQEGAHQGKSHIQPTSFLLLHLTTIMVPPSMLSEANILTSIEYGQYHRINCPSIKNHLDELLTTSSIYMLHI